MSEPRRVFFVHVMKTAGGTFSWYLRTQYGILRRNYPDRERDPSDAYLLIRPLLELPEARRRRIQAYAGHFPHVVTDLLGGDFTTFTIIHDPVDRTLSYLRQRARQAEPDRSLEEIFDDPFLRPTLIQDHQTKVFSMTAADPLESVLDVIDVDDARLRLACANLDRVDLVGITDEYEGFLRSAQTRMGWDDHPVPPQHVGPPAAAVPASFRRRIAEDNRIDMAFYEHARNRWSVSASASA